MESKGDKTANGVPRWAGPWQAGWSGMTNNSGHSAHSELARLGSCRRQDRLIGLPKNSRRRLQGIGVAATIVASACWLVAIAWLWPVIT